MERKIFENDFLRLNVREKYREYSTAEYIKIFAKEKVMEPIHGPFLVREYPGYEEEYQHIFEFINKNILNHLNKEMLVLIKSLIDHPNFRLIPMVFNERVIRHNYIKSESIRVYCSIVSNMLYDKRFYEGFEPIELAITHIMQVIYHIYTAYEIEQNKKYLPF